MAESHADQSALAAWCETANPDIALLFAILADTTGAPDSELPATGIPLDRERLLSPPLIVSDTYGTRCSTVFTLGRDGAAHFVERTFDPRGAALADVEYRFTVRPVR